MDLARIGRDAEDRGVVWAAVAAATIGAVSLVGAALAFAAGDTGPARSPASGPWCSR